MECLFSEEAIRDRIAELGREITEYYRGKPLTVVVIATGGIFFGADLCRRITLPLWVDVLRAASYTHDARTGELQLKFPPKNPPCGRNILLADEVLDSGTTLLTLKDLFEKMGAASVRTAVMFEKACARPSGPAHADWAGFSAPDRYLVGYGLDSEERYRNLPFVGAMDDPR